MSKQPRRSKHALLVSEVQEDSTIIETTFEPATKTTAFVIARDGGIETLAELNNGHDICLPVRPTNNLIKHRALLLPSEPVEYGTALDLLDQIAHYIQKYVSLSARATVVSASYVLLSWVYDAFNELPYLRFRGDYGTGKTRALLVIGSLCYKAFFASGASTVSPIFHTLDTFKGTLIFDEADFRFTDEKAELVKILNNGNAKGFPVLRTQVSPNKEFDPRAFVIFGPKIVGMRGSYEDRALESRFLTIDMEPGRSGRAPINLPDEQCDEALGLCNKLLMYRLRNRLTAGPIATLADPKLEPRMNQILLPLLSVLPDDSWRAAIRDMATTLQAEIVTERSSSPEGQTLATVVKILTQAPDKKISLSEITSAFASEFGREYERLISNRWIGGILRHLGIVLYKSNGVLVVMQGQEDRIGVLCKRYGIERAPASTAEQGR